ncbi:MAG: hypothetical protein OEN01_06155 [Candidatus Krumholzibacteria bacterium]|nr:hypothetical protein [Candidatus Krumholzibacteria bacterium]
MRLSSILLVIAVLFTVGLSTGAAAQATFEGTLKLGAIIFDEDAGDLSTVQETYNIEDGFSVSQIRLTGRLNPQNYFSLNLREVNLQSRKGELVYRGPSRLRLKASFDQHRQVFDSDRAVTSERKDWRVGAQVTPAKWIRLSGYYNLQDREGDRLSFPAGAVNQLGSQYDYMLQNWRAEAELRKDGRALAVAYDYSSLTDDVDDITDRTGNIVSARLFTPDLFFDDKLTHMFRAAYGKHEVSNSDLDYTLTNFQYTGAIRPHDRFGLKYNYHANRIEDDATGLQTDNFQNHFDATYYHLYGNLYGGYGYEINDDDKTLTNYNVWRLGGSLNYKKRAKVNAAFTSRAKTADADLTLLKDSEVDQFKAKVELRPTDDFAFGGRVHNRQRTYTDIDVEADGLLWNGFGAYEYPGWGGITGDFSYITDDYKDLAGRFKTNTQLVTGRVHFDWLKNLRLVSGVTYMDIGEDLDIEKTIVFVEGTFTVLNDYHLEVKYNVYNYDDYILIDRYYTANAVWINVAYDFRKE